jgi:hypothetical protein
MLSLVWKNDEVTCSAAEQHVKGESKPTPISSGNWGATTKAYFSPGKRKTVIPYFRRGKTT